MLRTLKLLFFSLSLFFYIFRLGLDLRVSLHTLKDHENCCIFHSKKKKVVVWPHEVLRFTLKFFWYISSFFMYNMRRQRIECVLKNCNFLMSEEMKNVSGYFFFFNSPSFLCVSSFSLLRRGRKKFALHFSTHKKRLLLMDEGEQQKKTLFMLSLVSLIYD